METFWELVWMRSNDNIEETETYDDIDDARADFLYFTQEDPYNYKYVILQEVTTNFADYEEIEVLDDWHNDEE